MNTDGLISLLLACIELLFLINLFVFAKKTLLNKLLLAQLFLLFGYQALEFFICGLGIREQWIIYAAFTDITLLPPLGLYSVLLYAGKLKNYHKLIFIPALFFIVYYLIVIDTFAVTRCTVLYASYYYPLGSLYATFYYLPIIGSMIILNKKWGSDTDARQKSLTRFYFFGYILTFIPAMIIAIFIPSFINAVESLLCKMAFVLAVFISIFVLKNKTE